MDPAALLPWLLPDQFTNHADAGGDQLCNFIDDSSSFTFSQSERTLQLEASLKLSTKHLVSRGATCGDFGDGNDITDTGIGAVVKAAYKNGNNPFVEFTDESGQTIQGVGGDQFSCAALLLSQTDLTSGGVPLGTINGVNSAGVEWTIDIVYQMQDYTASLTQAGQTKTPSAAFPAPGTDPNWEQEKI